MDQQNGTPDDVSVTVDALQKDFDAALVSYPARYNFVLCPCTQTTAHCLCWPVPCFEEKWYETVWL